MVIMLDMGRKGTVIGKSDTREGIRRRDDNDIATSSHDFKHRTISRLAIGEERTRSKHQAEGRANPRNEAADLRGIGGDPRGHYTRDYHDRKAHNHH